MPLRVGMLRLRGRAFGPSLFAPSPRTGGRHGQSLHEVRSASRIENSYDPGASSVARMRAWVRSEEHTSELQSLMRISYAVFCLQKNKHNTTYIHHKYII